MSALEEVAEQTTKMEENNAKKAEIFQMIEAQHNRLNGNGKKGGILSRLKRNSPDSAQP